MKLREVLNNPPKDYYSILAQVESSNNPSAKAKTSSAAGLYQFTEGTWNQITKELGLNYTLDDRFDPEKSRKVVQEFTNRNEKTLKNKLGRKPNDAELYLAHFSGAGGATKLLNAIQNNPNTSVTDFVSPSALKANKNVFFNKDGNPKKAYEIYNWSAKKFNSPIIEPGKKVNTFENTKQIEIDNTAVKTRDFIPLKTTATNATYAALPDLNVKKKQEPEKTGGIDEEQLRKILEQERRNTENKFLNAFKQQQPQEQYIPQQPQENLDYLYNYIDIENYSNGGNFTENKSDCPEGDTECEELRKLEKITQKDIDNTYVKPRIIPKNNTIGNAKYKDMSFKDITADIEKSERLEKDEYEDKYHVRGWTNNYINSPKFRERLESSGYENVEEEINKRSKNVLGTDIEDVEEYNGFWNNISRQLKGKPSYDIGSAYRNDVVYLHHPQASKYREDIDAVSAHEFKHSELDNKKGNLSNNLNDFDTEELKNRLKKSVKDNHSLKAEENAADLNSLRYKLQFEDYDAGKEDFTEEHLNKIPDNNFTKKRLLKNYSKEDLIWLMNNIASTETDKEQEFLHRLSMLS